MRLTLHFDYALRTLLFLAARPDRRGTTAEVSIAYGISKNHLVRVVQHLEEHGYVTLHSGRNGGVELIREPSTIPLGKLMRQIEPNMDLVECFNAEKNTCPITPVCRLKRILYEAGQAFVATLDKYTLADIAANSSTLLAHFHAK